jgi:riboflavin kinase
MDDTPVPPIIPIKIPPFYSAMKYMIAIYINAYTINYNIYYHLIMVMIKMKLFGRVVSGKGEGRYYMSLPPYKEKFKNILGFEPYEGTLNIKLGYGIKLNDLNPIEVDDFYYKNNKYYGVKLIPVRICIRDYCVNGAIVYPKKN